MKFVNESIFMNSLRAFFVALFGIFGVLVGLIVLVVLFSWLSSSSSDDTYSSKVKILPNAEGSRKHLGSHIPVLLQISINGEIGKDSLTASKIEEVLLDSRESDFKNDRVKGILLTINSPGGDANDSDIIYRYLKEYKSRFKVPIYAFVDGLCASGGYYIACAADKIYASDVSMVGSIGVLSWPPFMNVTDGLEKIGVNAMTLFAGKGKDEMNPFRPWKADEQGSYQELINFFYNRFVSIVETDRPHVDHEKLVHEYGAKVFPAPQAKEIGYIDESGNTRDEALSELAKAAGIEKYQVVTFETKSWWKKMFKGESASPLFSGRIRHEFSLPQKKGSPFCYLFNP